MNHLNLHRLYRNVKSGLVSGYHHTKNVLGHVDKAVNIGKHIYNAVEPLINRYAGNHRQAISDHVMKGLSGYESLRNKVLDANDHVQSVAGHLKKTLPLMRVALFRMLTF